jgi:hypothetical protein
MCASFQAKVRRFTALVEEAAKKNRQLIALGSKCPSLVPLTVVLLTELFLIVVPM